MSLRITTLCENTAGSVDVVAEFGWSALVETDGKKILFDTGTEFAVPLNADALNINLSEIDNIVLSHGHIDHTGGLGKVLEKTNKQIEVVGHPNIWSERYNRSEKSNRFIGIPFRREQLEAMGAVFRLDAEPVKISDKITTTGEIPMVTDFEKTETPDAEGYGTWAKIGNELKPDAVPDDLALVIKTNLGLVVVSGCAHRGIINTIYHAQKISGENRVYAVIGGSHLSDIGEERIYQTIQAIKDLDIKKVGLCHCTGLSVSVIMAQELGERFFFNDTGSIFELP